MKNFIMYLLVKWFGVDFIDVYIRAEQSREERTHNAMAYLLSEGMTQRNLSPWFIRFIKELQSGSKDKRLQRAVIYRDVLDNIDPSESTQLAAHTLLAPYTDSKEYPEQLLYRVCASISPLAKKPISVLSFVKILSEALVKEVGPQLPIETARAVAAVVYHTEKLNTGKVVK